jgi:branched-chain amino acid transport system permease protein
MTGFLQALIDGLLQGAVLSLAAVGFSLIFGVLGVVNLSHGILVVLGAYLALLAKRTAGLDPLAAMPLVAAISFAAGYLYQRCVISPAIRRASLLASLLITYAVALIAQNAFVLLFSPDFQSVRPDYANVFWRVDGPGSGGLTFNLLQLVTLAASLVLIGLLSLILNRLPVGRTIRATAEQELAARLCGVDIDGIYALTFAMAAAFAGAAGVLIGMLFPFSPASQENWTIYGFVVVVLGGIGSASGALFGGLMLGVISTLTTHFVGAAYPNAMVFLVLVLMLLARPTGLTGNALGVSR